MSDARFLDNATFLDTLGATLIGTFIGVLTIFAMWVSLWDNVWRVSVEPGRNLRHSTQSPWPFAMCLRSSWMWWRSAGTTGEGRANEEAPRWEMTSAPRSAFRNFCMLN
jgi:hypothetical protein